VGDLDDLMEVAYSSDAVIMAWDLLHAPLISALSHRLLGGPTPLVALCDSEEVDYVAALAVGADIVLPMPPPVRLLKAQVAAHQRRRVALLMGNSVPEATASRRALRWTDEGRVLRAGPLAMDLVSLTAQVGGEPVDLTPIQFHVLALLVENAETTLTRDRFLSGIWGLDFETGTNVVDVHVHFVRRALKERGLSDVIRTVRGVGYVFELSPQRADGDRGPRRRTRGSETPGRVRPYGE
jgi:DNA-binding response OmpR family regulator